MIVCQHRKENGMPFDTWTLRGSDGMALATVCPRCIEGFKFQFRIELGTLEEEETMITLKNPETGQKHMMDEEAMKEFAAAYKEAVDNDRQEVVFRAMRLDMSSARQVMAAI